MKASDMVCVKCVVCGEGGVKFSYSLLQKDGRIVFTCPACAAETEIRLDTGLDGILSVRIQQLL